MNSPLRELEPRPSDAFDTHASALAGCPAFHHPELVDASLRLTQQIAALITQAGDLYAPSVRDQARRLSEDSAAIALSLRAIRPGS